jgi:hypothetical protein
MGRTFLETSGARLGNQLIKWLQKFPNNVRTGAHCWTKDQADYIIDQVGSSITASSQAAMTAEYQTLADESARLDH